MTRRVLQMPTATGDPTPRFTWTLTTNGDLLRLNHQRTASVIQHWQDRHGLPHTWDAVLPEYRQQREPAPHPDVIRLPGQATAQQVRELAGTLADLCSAEVHIGQTPART